ncbi:MAG: sigma-54-dependent Fis family transcriptional regulator [Deltaproteobacteria bacterium]|nr:sigma-54-dependent Fis family transcriptional regulator [Deltaproteobacteria bacterium]
MSLGGSVLLVDDTPMNLDVLVGALSDAGLDVFVATDGEKALGRAKLVHPDLVLLDVMMPGMDGFETCRRMKADPELADIPVVFMTALTNTEDKLAGFAAGGVDYVTKPIQHAEVLARVEVHLTLRRLQRALAEANQGLEEKVKERTAELEALKAQLERENRYLREEVQGRLPKAGPVGRSPAFMALMERVDAVAASSVSVLVLGESGVGKELVAQQIHLRSPRKAGPLVKVNCASVPRELFESEFFGHVKGAFTGAHRDREGRFALADGGTLFLDEVGEIPLELQSKLLRVLQEREYERVGDHETRRVDVRVVAATNRDLKAEVAAGRFREDLYYRLGVFPIEVPPLRARREDVVPLAELFLSQAAAGRPELALDAAGQAALTAYEWPGNVRELQNVVERAVIISRGARLEVEKALGSSLAPALAPPPRPGSDEGRILTVDQLRTLERDNMVRALDAADWKVSGPDGAAARLGMKPTTLQSRMKALDVQRPGRAHP